MAWNILRFRPTKLSGYCRSPLPWVKEVTVNWPKQETAHETFLAPRVIFCVSLDKKHLLYLRLVEKRACFSAWPITTRADNMHQSELGENVKRAGLPSAGKWERLACLPASVSTQDCREAGVRAVTFCVSLGKIHLFNKTIPNKQVRAFHCIWSSSILLSRFFRLWKLVIL